ncbi:MAG: TIGR00269 family protein [Candidatus Hodarchaeales archaeon]
MTTAQKMDRPALPRCACGKKAFVRTSTTPNIVCKDCFGKRVQDRVRRTINKYRMFREGDIITIGLSGGKDSTVLLDILNQLQRAHPRSYLSTVVIDEGISKYRDEAIRFARLAAEKAEMELHLISFEELFGYSLDTLVSRISYQSYGQKPCSICGKLRRYALNRVAREIGATKLATGHNLDDEVQTCLLNMLRGDDFRFRRLFRKPVRKHPQLVPRVKPLVELAEREIQLYARAKGIQYHDAECPYAPTAMRNDVRRFLLEQEEKRPGTLLSILRFHDRLMAQEDNRTGAKLAPCTRCGEPASAETCSVCKTLEIIER